MPTVGLSFGTGRSGIANEATAASRIVVVGGGVAAPESNGTIGFGLSQASHAKGAAAIQAKITSALFMTKTSAPDTTEHVKFAACAWIAVSLWVSVSQKAD